MGEAQRRAEANMKEGRVQVKIKAQVVGLTTVVLENGDVIVMQVNTAVVHAVIDRHDHDGRIIYKVDSNGRTIYEMEPQMAIGWPVDPG